MPQIGRAKRTPTNGDLPMSIPAARIALLAAALLWSSSGAFAKLIVVPAPVMACYRVLFAGAFCLLFLRREAVRFRPAMFGMMFCFAVMNVSFISAMTMTTAANAIFLQYTAPAWMFIASLWWLHERFEFRNLATVIIGLIGIGVIVSGGGAADLPGISVGLLAGVTYAGVAIFLRALRHENPNWLTVLNLLASGFVLLPVIGVLFGVNGFAVAPEKLLALAAFGIVQMAIPYLLFSRALQAVSAQEAGIITLLEPVANPILTYFAAGEIPGRHTALGGAIILLGVAVRYLPIRRTAELQSPPRA